MILSNPHDQQNTTISFSCNDQLLYEARADGDLNRIKYYSTTCGLDYKYLLYNDLSYEMGLQIAKRLSDLAGARFLLDKFSKNYPEDLYVVNSHDSLERAIRLYDLEGIKYALGFSNTIDLGINNSLVVYSNKHFINLKDKINYAISIGDLDGIKYLLANNKLNEKEVKQYLKFAYYKEELKIAYFITHHYCKAFQNGEHSPHFLLVEAFTGVLRSNPIKSYSSYTEHFVNLLENKNYQTVALKFIDTMFSEPNDNFFYFNKGYNSLTLDNILNIEAHLISHFSIREVIKFFYITNHDVNNRVHVFIPSKTSNITSFFSFFKIDDLFKHNRIYFSYDLNKNPGYFIHEVAHAFFYVLFDNNGYPYNNLHTAGEYDRAVNQTLENIALAFTKEELSFDTTEFKLLLQLNHWYMLYTREVNRTKILFKKIYPSDGNISLVNQERILERHYQKFFKKFEWSEEHKHVLDRIYDYFMYENSTKQDAEFLVRVPELYMNGVGDEIMRNFNPAVQYWQEHVSPIFRELRHKHFIECKKSIQINDRISDCAVNALSNENKLDIWYTSIELRCIPCFEDVVFQSVPKKQKKEMLNLVAEKIDNCVEYCVDQHDCQNIYKSFFYVYLPFFYSSCTKIYKGDASNSKLERIAEAIILHDQSILNLADYDTEL